MAELPVSQNMGESLLVRQESCLSFSIKAGGEGQLWILSYKLFHIMKSCGEHVQLPPVRSDALFLLRPGSGFV